MKLEKSWIFPIHTLNITMLPMTILDMEQLKLD